MNIMEYINSVLANTHRMIDANMQQHQSVMQQHQKIIQSISNISNQANQANQVSSNYTQSYSYTKVSTGNAQSDKLIKHLNDLVDSYKWSTKTEWQYDRDQCCYIAEFVTISNEIVRFKYHIFEARIEIISGPESKDISVSVAGWLTKVDDFIKEYLAASDKRIMLQFIYDFMINNNMAHNKAWEIVNFGSNFYYLSKFNTQKNIVNVRYYPDKQTIELTSANPKYNNEEFDLADPNCFEKLKDYVKTI